MGMQYVDYSSRTEKLRVAKIFEDYYDVKLLPNYIVYHINGDKLDTSKENLIQISKQLNVTIHRRYNQRPNRLELLKLKLRYLVNKSHSPRGGSKYAKPTQKQRRVEIARTQDELFALTKNKIYNRKRKKSKKTATVGCDATPAGRRCKPDTILKKSTATGVSSFSEKKDLYT